MLNKIVRDPFGQHYKIHTTHDGIVTGPLSPKSFRTPESAQMFVNSLQTQTGCWQYLVGQCNSPFTGLSAQHSSTEQQVSQLLLSGQVKLYPITLPKLTDSSPKRRTIKGGDRVNYQFTPVANMLIVKPREVKKFNDKTSAETFLAELNPDEKQLKALATELDIPISSTASINPAELTDSITTAMANGEVVIIVDRISGAPPGEQQSKENNPVGNRPIADESADVSGDEKNNKNQKAEKDKKPLCKNNLLTIQCRHGRSVTLNPGDKTSPILEVVSTTKELTDAEGKNLLEEITITSDITDVCQTHKKGHISGISAPTHVKIKHTKEGKEAKINTPSKYLNVRKNPLKYFWLSKIEPQKYIIYQAACDKSRFKDTAKGIEVHVYPEIEWDFKVGLGMGSASIKMAEDEATESLKKELSKKKFGISGAVSLKQEGETFEVNDEFSKSIKDTVSKLETISKYMERTFSKFDEGYQPAVSITWPNFTFTLKTKIEETSGPKKSTSFEFGIGADPFIGIETSVDLLPILLTPLTGGIPGRAILKKIFKKITGGKSLDDGIGSKDGIAHLKGKVAIPLTAKGDLKFDFSAKALDGKIEKLVGNPIKTTIELKATGLVEIDGHILKVKIKFIAGIGIKSSIEIKASFVDDQTGLYWQPEYLFNGVRVFVYKYIKPKEDLGENNGSADVKFDDDELPPTEQDLILKDEKEHVWIKPRKVKTEPHYLVTY